MYTISRLKQDYLWFSCLQTNPHHKRRSDISNNAQPNQLKFHVHLLQTNHKIRLSLYIRFGDHARYLHTRFYFYWAWYLIKM